MADKRQQIQSLIQDDEDDTVKGRALESREREARAHDNAHEGRGDQWEKPLNISTELQPRTGYAQRWVRYRLHSEEEHGNVIKKLQEGWRPRQKSTVPEGFFILSNKLTVSGHDFGDVVMTHDMVLMERPAEVHERYRAQKKSYEAQVQMMVDEATNAGDIRAKGIRRPNVDTRREVTFEAPR